MLSRASRNRRGKKGVFAFEAVMWITRSLILVFILLSVMFVTRAFIVRDLDTRFADSYSLMNLMYYSSKATAVEDGETGRTYPGLVDAAAQGNLDSVFSYGEGTDGSFMASKASAPLKAGEKEFFYRKDVFDDWNFLYIAGLTKGSGGIIKVSASKKLVVEESGTETGSDVKFEVVTRNV